MPYPITSRLLSKLTPRQLTAYQKAKEIGHPHLDPKAVDRVADARMFYRSIGYGQPEYLSKIEVKDEFDDGTPYTRCYIVVPRDEPIRPGQQHE
jgi:hypothetical protein